MKLESLSDRLVNKFINFKYFLRFKRKSEPSTANMKLVFEDNFSTFDKKRWRVSQPWGNFHPDSLYDYYGENSVSVDDKLILQQKYSPKEFELNGEKITIPYSIGLITSLDAYGYGFYEFDIQLPKGIGLWPAVWLTSFDSWPPEIDILEAYSDENCNYGKRLQSNLHFDYTPNNKNIGGMDHIIKNPLDKLTVSCWWTKDFIKIYYNGYLFRKTTSEDILKWFRDKKMIIILNNGMRSEYIPMIDNSITTEFFIYSVKYWSE